MRGNLAKQDTASHDQDARPSDTNAIVCIRRDSIITY